MQEAFTIKRIVQFVETDRAGVLHFSNYFRWMEEVECAFWRAQNRSVVTFVEGGEISWPRVATQCEYMAPARFEDEIELALRVVEVSRKSVTYQVEFLRHGKRIALGRSKAVCCMVTPDSFSSIEIPDEFRTLLSAHLATPED